MQQPERSSFSPTAPSPSYTADNTLPPLQVKNNDRKLPSLSFITNPDNSDMSSLARTPVPPHLHGAMPYRQAATSVEAPDMDVDTIASAASTPSTGQKEGTPASVNLEDPDVRLAAEALGDLRADFVSSPPDTSMSPPPDQPPRRTRPEPLLSLLTTSHPLVASTIGGASSAYGGVKNFSPRFKSGAEYVEGYLTPLAKTVNVVGRKTGVEGGVRWFLGGKRRGAPTSEPDAGLPKKARKVNDANGHADDSSPSTPKGSRRLSEASTVDTLPAYDELRSPAYTESADGQTMQQPPNHAWQTRLFMTTSGLSVAMSSESLKSLKYCLKWLRLSNEHMGRTITNLKTALEDYEKAGNPDPADEDGAKDDDEAMAGAAEGGSGTKTPEEKRVEIANRIQTIKGDILKTLQEVVTTVSKYAGGSLPENARVLVRRHLTSLPQRFRLATMSDNRAVSGDARDRDSALRDGAQKVLVLAKEGLDMVTQISGVLDGTITSAEEWCERIGKKKDTDTDDKDEAESAVVTEHVETAANGTAHGDANGDVKMA